MTGIVPGPATPRTRAQGLEGHVCAEAWSYERKLGKAERKRREAESKQEAFNDLARKAWYDAFGRDSSDSGAPDTEQRFASLRSRYRVNAHLGGGDYVFIGNKRRKKVDYCIPEEQYETALARMREQREQTIRVLRLRFEELEGLIDEGELADAARKLTPLSIEVITEAAEKATFESGVDDRTRTFAEWLRDWNEVVPRGEGFAEFMTERAAELMHQGYLEEADRYVAEAVDADREYAPAHAVRAEIQARRVQNVELLEEAERLATVGRFAAAQERIDRAEAISRDDPFLLEETIKNVDGQRAVFLQLNPKARGLFVTTFGGLGFDTGATETAMSDVIGLSVDGTPLLNLGGGGNFRFGRFFLLSFGGSYGFSQDQRIVSGTSALELYNYTQLTTGIGYRSLRTDKRKVAVQLIAGPVWEWVGIDGVFGGTGLGTSDSQLALFARLAVEFSTIQIVLQQGFGFSDSPGSLVAWSDHLQFGIAFGF